MVAELVGTPTNSRVCKQKGLLYRKVSKIAALLLLL